MKKLKVNIEYNLPTMKGQETPNNYKLTENYFTTGVGESYKQIEGQARRIFTRILNKIDEAEKTNSDYIELEKSEQDMFKKVFDDKTSFSPIIARYVTKLEDEVEIMLKLEDAIEKDIKNPTN